jgi:RimJ/RimL family protein N-acetyltransferase
MSSVVGARAWTVHTHTSPDAFLAEAGAWLLAAEAENNLVLGLVEQLRQGNLAVTPPLLLATVRGPSGEVEGCVFRTPPFKLGLTRLPAGAVQAVVEAVAGIYDALPAALGPEPEVEAFGAAWAARQGVACRPGMRQRIHALERVTAPPRPAAGLLRVAGLEDAPTIVEWLVGFRDETHVQAGDPAGVARRLIERRDLFLWDDRGPASMAAAAAYTPNGARVGWVYTPPALRGRGYASACVAALSRALLDRGLRHLFLYTDLANPVSNAIYARLGYQPVLDVRDVDFGPAEMLRTTASE